MTTPKLTKSHLRTITLLPENGWWDMSDTNAPGIRALGKAHPELCESEIEDAMIHGKLTRTRMGRLTPAGIAVKAALEAKP